VVPVLVVFVLVLVPTVDCSAASQSIFAFRASDGWLIEIIPPDTQTGSSGTIKKTFVGDVWEPYASTREDSGRIISSGPAFSRLDAYDPFSGAVEEVCVFSQSWMNSNDLTFGPSGELLWANSGPTGTTLYAVDIESCELTERGSFAVNHLHSIEYHQGAFYSTGEGAEIYRIDPSSLDVTTVMAANYFCGVFGLSSNGDDLYFGMSCSTGGSFPTSTAVGVVDPHTGDVIWSVIIPNDQYWEGYSMLEVLQQPVRPIPAAGAVGGGLTAVLVGLAGALFARRF